MGRLRPAMAIICLLGICTPASAGVFDCAGDCSGNRAVSADEIVAGVRIALEGEPVATCERSDLDGDERVTVDELLAAVANGVLGCGEAGLLVSGIEFVPESFDVGGNRTRLLRIGQDLVFTDGSDTPVKALHLPSRRVRPIARRMGVPGGMTHRDGALFWTESRSGIAPSGCAGAGVIRLLNRTTIESAESLPLARADDCGQAAGDVVLGPSHAYWISSLVSPQSFRIVRTPLTGGVTTIVHTTSDRIGHMEGHGSHLYWIETSLVPGEEGSVMRQRFDGGQPEAVFEGVRYFGQSQGGFAAGAGFVFFANPTGAASYDMLRVAADGGTPEVLARVGKAPRGYAVSGETLYWIDEESLNAVATGGGSMATIAAELDSPVDLSAAAGGVVWSESRCCAHGQKGTVSFYAPPGPVRTLVEGVDSPDVVSGDTEGVFWGEGGAIGLIEGFGRVATISVAGGEVRTLAQGVSVPLPEIATDGVSVFVADRFRVKRLPAEGGLAETLAAGDFFVTAIAAGSGQVYWAEEPFPLIRRVATSGGTVETLAIGSGRSDTLAADAAHVYWSEALDRIRRVPIGGGAVETAASGLSGLSDFVLDADAIYFSEQDTGRISSLSRGSGTISSLAVGLAFSWNYLALDPGSVYWINQEHLARVAKGGGMTAILADQLDSRADIGSAVLVDGEAVYWTEIGAGTLRALPR